MEDIGQKRVREFVALYNRLEKVLKEKVNNGKGKMSFYELTRRAVENKDKVVTYYKKDLDLIRKFRNLLLHEHVNIENYLAVPSDYLVDITEQLIEKISRPQRVKDLFLKDVKSFSLDDSLSTVLKEVEATKYTQFPVFDKQRLVGIISDNGITLFLSQMVAEDIISIQETKVSDVINYDEEKESFDVVIENKSIYDINEMYEKQIKEGNTNYIVLISNKSRESIQESKDITGIITPWDVPMIEQNK